MNVKQIWLVYWSATGNTRRLVNVIGNSLKQEFGCPYRTLDLTPLEARKRERNFEEGDLVVVGSPIYAGKLPNKILPDLKEGLKGNGAFALPIVTFGNRSFDHGLAELCHLLETNGFHTISAGAFVGRHGFSDRMAFARPDEKDCQEARKLAVSTAEIIKKAEKIPAPIQVEGNWDAPYYIPKGRDGQPVSFLKAKPKTRKEDCDHCGICGKVCPMGAIKLPEVFEIVGTCIKCQACVRSCPKHAKYFDDPAFLSHVAMLEEHYQAPKENQVWLGIR